jgi:hypothetical protein
MIAVAAAIWRIPQKSARFVLGISALIKTH